MSNGASALEQLDALLFLALNHILAGNPEGIEPVLEKIVPLSKLDQLRFNQPKNILRSFIFGASPVSADLSILSNFAKQLESSDLAGELLEVSQLFESVEDIWLWISREFAMQLPEEDDAFEVALALEADYAQRSQAIGYTSYCFEMAKIIELSRYTADLSQYDFLVRANSGNRQLSDWHHGVVAPYNNFVRNFPLSLSPETPAFEYLSRQTYQEKLDYFLTAYDKALEKNSVAFCPQKLLPDIVLPLAMYYEADISSLLDWIYQERAYPSWLSRLQTLQSANEVVLKFADHEGRMLSAESQEGFVRKYIALIYYFAFYLESAMLSVDISRAYDLIDNSVTTLIELLDVMGSGGNLLHENTNLEDLPIYADFTEFVESSKNPLRPLYELDIKLCLAFLKNVTATCCQIYPVNGLTISKYLQLSQTGSSDPEGVKKEILRVLAHLEPSNHMKLLHSVKLIVSSFVRGDEQLESDIDQLVFERLLGVGLFLIANSFFHNTPSLTADQAFEAVLKKYKISFDEATSLDERSGSLKDAHECISLLSELASNLDVNGSHKEEVARLKHLSKALVNLKNFKLSLDGRGSAKPRDVLNKVTKIEDDELFTPFAIVSHVLEHNPKSYHAFEKLYRIVNDLAIYLNIDVSHVPFARIQSACIESALIDNNFDFAYKHCKIIVDLCSADDSKNLGDYWLTFYQTAKYVSPDWFNDDDIMMEKRKLDIYIKQRELLLVTLKHTKPSSTNTDNSRLILSQLRRKESEIDALYETLGNYSQRSTQMRTETPLLQVSENAGKLFNEASKTTSHASEKISNLFVSGLGWAIGANRRSPQN